MTYPGNYAVRIQTGTVDIVPSGPTGIDLLVIARLPLRMGEADIVKRRAYLMAAAPGLAAALEKLIAAIEPHHAFAFIDEILDARHALAASRVPEPRS